MGWFVYFQGPLTCLRCKRPSEAWVQTKLLRCGPANQSRPYRVGDTEVLDGLSDYCPLYSWDSGSPLTVAVGDWECRGCSLAWQWAKAVFDVEQEGESLVGTLRELSPLAPYQVSDLNGVHFLEADLAELSGLWGQENDWHKGLARWKDSSVEDRCGLVASGFRSWWREVTDIDTPG